jgi:hypothetical protein
MYGYHNNSDMFAPYCFLLMFHFFLSDKYLSIYIPNVDRNNVYFLLFILTKTGICIQILEKLPI